MFVLKDIATEDDGVAVGNHAGNQILQPLDAKRQQKTVGRHGSRFGSKVDLPCLSSGFSLSFLVLLALFRAKHSVFRIRAGC